MQRAKRNTSDWLTITALGLQISLLCGAHATLLLLGSSFGSQISLTVLLSASPYTIPSQVLCVICPYIIEEFHLVLGGLGSEQRRSLVDPARR